MGVFWVLGSFFSDAVITFFVAREAVESEGERALVGGDDRREHLVGKGDRGGPVEEVLGFFELVGDSYKSMESEGQVFSAALIHARN